MSCGGMHKNFETVLGTGRNEIQDEPKQNVSN